MTETKKRRLHPPEIKAKLGLELGWMMQDINKFEGCVSLHYRL
jgi:hypothetical protein